MRLHGLEHSLRALYCESCRCYVSKGSGSTASCALSRRIQDFGLGGALAEGPPAGSRGRPPVGVWGKLDPRSPYVIRLKTERKTSPYILILYDNIILSSSHPLIILYAVVSSL